MAQNTGSRNNGYTLIEVIVVVALIAIFTVIALPKITGVLNKTESENLVILSGIITKTFDDSFLNDRINYLIVHLHGATPDPDDPNKNIFQRKNGVSVVTITDGVFHDSTRNLLKPKLFPDYFQIEDVILENGEKISEGNVLLPFYPQGYSGNAIIHVRVHDEDQWSLRLYRYRKNPEMIRGYISFDYTGN